MRFFCVRGMFLKVFDWLIYCYISDQCYSIRLLVDCDDDEQLAHRSDLHKKQAVFEMCTVCVAEFSYQPVLFVGQESSLLSPSTSSARKRVSHHNSEKGNLNCYCIRNEINFVYACFALNCHLNGIPSHSSLSQMKSKIRKGLSSRLCQ